MRSWIAQSACTDKRGSTCRYSDDLRRSSGITACPQEAREALTSAFHPELPLAEWQLWTIAPTRPSGGVVLHPANIAQAFPRALIGLPQFHDFFRCLQLR